MEREVNDFCRFSFDLDGKKIQFELPLDKDLTDLISKKDLKFSGSYECLTSHITGKKVISKLIGLIYNGINNYNVEILDFCPDCFKYFEKIEVPASFSLSGLKQTELGNL
ncbi:MAG: hypothetical protein PHO49_02700 [Candidatus Nanoarchaeia archaeon]|nr:hypothetical protein [Candidatus Nanoarchaeia archaeon]